MNYERANHRWDEARDAQLTELWTEGRPIADIAVRMFTTVGAIADRRFLLGLPKRKNPSQGWTDERIDLTKRLWIEGKSATQIAMILNCGMSRNAVIGKIHRLGLSQHGRAPCAAPPPDVRKRTFSIPKVKRSHVRPPKPGPQNKPAVILGAYQTSTPGLQAERTAEGRAVNARVARGGDVESPNARPWMDARKLNECNWPIGERGAILSCCNPVKARGWCAGHLAMGTVPTIPMRPRAASSYARFDRVERDGPMKPYVEQSAWDEGRAA